LVLAAPLLALGCSTPDAGPADGGAPPDSSAPATADSCAPPPPTSDALSCPVTVAYTPPRTAKVTIAGEWNNFSPSSQPLSGPDAQGAYRVTLQLPPGLYAYKFVLDGTDWQLDPVNSYRKYSGGIENSGLRVADCHHPSLRIEPGSLQVSRPADGQGSLVVRVRASAAVGTASGLCSLSAEVRGNAEPPQAPPQAQVELSPDRTYADVRVDELRDGKYTLVLTPQAHGRAGDELLLPFWIEPVAFSYADTPLYMAMTDRFVDGDGKNPGLLPGVRQSANYQGGDLAGVTQKIEAGYFDDLGVRALWLTPWNVQPDGPQLDATNQYEVSPYHGYWPIRARQVDPRLGGADALHALVRAAHRHGIRVLMDSVINHVHEQHEYHLDPKRQGWFRTDCICGTPGCDWTERRLTCLFAPYLPDINWTVPEASEQFIADALWWLEEFDLDGLRVDAVKHVEDAAILNLTARIRERFEQAGTRYYLLGETAMGWNEGTIADNADNYDTIKRYLGPAGLDGQFDFVWYHAIAYRVFAYDDKRFLHVDYWSHASISQFAGSLMVPFLGSHDTSRFITQATYRDATAGSQWNRDIANNKWDNLPAPPPDQEPYDRLWLGMVTVMTLPGMPLLYYGDEYGEYGGSDPDNRHMMRFAPGLNSRESAQLVRMKALLKARAELRGLRRGDMLTVLLGEDQYAYARLDHDPQQTALVVLNRTATQSTVAVPLPAELGYASGTVLRDRLGGDTYVVSDTVLMVDVPARGALVLAPK
jgi:glycosidase